MVQAWKLQQTHHFVFRKGKLLLLVCFAVLAFGAAAIAQSGDNQPTGTKTSSDSVDERGVFDASFYVGLSIDTFAGDETLHYLNPQDAGQTHERAVGGFDFAYRLIGNEKLSPPKDNQRWQRLTNIWVIGETVHGVRSADVNCSTQGTDSPLCAKTLTPPTNPGNQLFSIIRSATSLEGYGGIRWEFLGLQQQSDTPANVYLKAQAGFLDIAAQNGSALALHDVALGAIATKGSYVGSYLEVGWGRSDTFAKNHGRKKIDAYLERKIDWLKINNDAWMSFFAQITVDTDLGRGSDAIQSYIGFNFDLKRLLGQDNSGQTAAPPSNKSLLRRFFPRH
jgi:hypothetical protein